MTRLRPRHLALLVALMASAACAGTAQTAGTRASKITPPQRLSAGDYPTIREPVDLRIEVLISADGEPDLKTLKVTGKGSGSYHTVIEDWVRGSTFKPAMQDGHPVAAVIRMGLMTRIERR